MKMLKGMTIIFISLFLGEFISRYLAVPLPGNILGMVFLFLGLAFNLINIESVEKAGDLLLDNLILFFIPVGVGIIQFKDLIIEEITAIFVIGIGGFLLLFIIMGKIIDFLNRKGGSEHDTGVN